MKRTLNRPIGFMLAVLMLISLCTGCTGKEAEASMSEGVSGKEPSTSISADTDAKDTDALKICVDLGSFSAVYEPGMGNGMADGNQQHAMQQFEADLKGYLQMNSLDPIELEIEYIPEYTQEGNPERETMIARLRTEIMSGKGPDIFLLGCNDRYMEPLFKVPEKNMANGVFLPLNDYIENAQFIEFDKLVPGVMSAGQYDDEQYILPLTYTMPLTIYNASEVQDTPSKTMTWEQMLEGESYLRHAAYFYSETGFSDLFLLNSFGQIADYENEKLLLTEEELSKRIEEMIALEKIRFYSEDAEPELPTNWQVYLCYGFDQLAKWRGNQLEGTPFLEESDPSLAPLEEPFTIVPMYSDDGGAMATVLTYAAINANTRQPEKAFFVLDYLFGLKSQQSSSVFHLTCLDAIPVHIDLLQEEYPLVYQGSSYNLGTYYLDEGTYKELREIQELITGATFSSELYYELESMYSKCTYAYRKGESYEGTVAETYDILKQIMAE